MDVERNIEMGYTVRIRHNGTQEVRSRHYDFEWNEYWWTEGNMSCDCNLQMEFARAGGEKVDMDEGIPCSEGRFTALDAVLDNGETIIIAP